jgi:hypothetical protein
MIWDCYIQWRIMMLREPNEHTCLQQTYTLVFNKRTHLSSTNVHTCLQQTCTFASTNVHICLQQTYTFIFTPECWSKSKDGRQWAKHPAEPYR